MVVEKIDRLPERRGRTRSTFSEIIHKLNAIMDAGVKYGRVIFDNEGYVSIASMRGSLSQAAKKHDYPLLFELYDGELYFTRLDM